MAIGAVKLQLVTTTVLPCHGRGRGFESCRPRHRDESTAKLARKSLTQKQHRSREVSADSITTNAPTAQLRTQLFARLMQLRFGVPDRTPAHSCDLIVVVTLHIMEEEHRFITLG